MASISYDGYRTHASPCMDRNSLPEVFCKKGVLRNFSKFTGKHLCQSLFLNKVAAPRPATLLKNRLWHWCFPGNFAKFLRTPFFTAQLRCLLLYGEYLWFKSRALCVFAPNKTFSLCFLKDTFCFMLFFPILLMIAYPIVVCWIKTSFNCWNSAK